MKTYHVVQITERIGAGTNPVNEKYILEELVTRRHWFFWERSEWVPVKEAVHSFRRVHYETKTFQSEKNALDYIKFKLTPRTVHRCIMGNPIYVG